MNDVLYLMGLSGAGGFIVGMNLMLILQLWVRPRC